MNAVELINLLLNLGLEDQITCIHPKTRSKLSKIFRVTDHNTLHQCLKLETECSTSQDVCNHCEFIVNNSWSFCPECGRQRSPS